MHRCYGDGHYDPYVHRCYGAGLLFVYFQLWNGFQYAIPKVWRVVFPNVSVQCGIVHSDVNGLLYCSLLPIILKFSTDVVCPVLLWCSCIGDGAFRCSLYLSSEVLADSPMHSSLQSILSKLVPVAYFSGLFSKTQQLWNINQKECYAVYRSIQTFSFYLAGTKCILYCDHQPFVPVFTTGMSGLVLDHWALELQQFNIQFEHISGKKNVVVNAIPRLRTLGLYQDNGNTDLAKTDDDIVDNVVEVHVLEWIPNSAT